LSGCVIKDRRLYGESVIEPNVNWPDIHSSFSPLQTIARGRSHQKFAFVRLLFLNSKFVNSLVVKIKKLACKALRVSFKLRKHHDR
jgi:hypothetical protein